MNDEPTIEIESTLNVDEDGRVSLSFQVSDIDDSSVPSLQIAMQPMQQYL